MLPLTNLFQNLILIALLSLNLTSSTSPSSKDATIIIVGAGPAGIAAATKLLENNFTKIQIVEAEDRIGGRINSVKFGDAFVDVGAEFCHGQENNIVYELVKDLNVLKSEPRFHQTLIYYSNGSRIEKNLSDAFFNFVLEFESISGRNYTDEISLRETFLNLYNSKLLTKYKGDPEAEKILKEAVNLAKKFLIGAEASFNWNQTSGLSHYEDSPGDYLLTWNGLGYKTILDVLMKSYPDPSKKLAIDDKIQLNKKVEKISWNHEKPVVSIYNATQSVDHVIFTPSIGVLKKDSASLFEPQLPKEKQEAIENLGFGAIIKVILHYPTKWWRDDFQFSFLWSENDLKNSNNEFKGYSWVTQIIDICGAPNNPNVLILLITGELVPEIEQLSLDTVKTGVDSLLRKFLGRDYNITDSDKILMSRWYSNPNFRGTWSSEKTGFYKDLNGHQHLSEPLILDSGKPVLLFAGEATSPTHFSTVHGAIETGFREAQRIIDYYNKQ